VIQVRDSFLHYLADNLPDITIHPRRFDVNNPNSETLMEGAVNVEFFDITPHMHVSSQRVALDVVYADEREAVSVMNQLWSVLVCLQAPLKDYTIPASPVLTGQNMMWDKVSFKRISSQYYCHYLCLLTLEYHISL
jgi:hypothetical protein